MPDDRVFNASYVYKLKRDATSGLVSRFKAHLIVQGFCMKKDVDYNDTFSPIPGSTASRMMISLATSQDWELHSCDFIQVFIQADRLPEGVNGRFLSAPLLAPQTMRINTWSTKSCAHFTACPALHELFTRPLTVTSRV